MKSNLQGLAAVIVLLIVVVAINLFLNPSMASVYLGTIPSLVKWFLGALTVLMVYRLWKFVQNKRSERRKALLADSPPDE